jgi:hypothetical protein
MDKSQITDNSKAAINRSTQNKNSALAKAINNAKRCLIEARDPSFSKLKEYKSLLYKSEHRIMSPESAISWCIKYHLPSFSYSTWKVYASGYKQLLELALNKERITKASCEAALAEINAVNIPKKPAKKIRRQSFPAGDLNKILEVVTGTTNSLRKDNYKSGFALANWLQASVLTALEPLEWKSAKVVVNDKGKQTLQYSKTLNQAANVGGSATDIDLFTMNQKSIALIKNHVALVEAYVVADKFDELLNGCRSLLIKINKRIWPRRKVNISLNTDYQIWSHDFTFVDLSKEIEERILEITKL